MQMMDPLTVSLFLLGSAVIPSAVDWLLFKFYGEAKARKAIFGKVVLITGASSGLGEAIAHSFYRAGCRVILASRREDELERVKADLLALHVNVETFLPRILVLDLSKLSSLTSVAQEALQFFGRIDILINNGGVSFRGDAATTLSDVDVKVMTVNYFGQICLTKALLPSMIKAGQGHIVAVSSVQGRIAIPHRSAYAASKHALQAFFDSLRSEVYEKGIKVTVVSPGYIKTNLSLNAVTADGGTYATNDKSTMTGYSSHYVASKILESVLHERDELVIAPLAPKAAILIRTLCPPLYFYIMKKRAQKAIE